MIDLIDETDLLWIESVVDIVERNAGRPWRIALDELDDLQRALQLRPPSAGPRRTSWRPDAAQRTVARRFRAVVGAVQRLTGGRARNVRIARTARGLTLGHPAFTPAERSARIDHAASVLGVTAAVVETLLWSDLPRERPIELPGNARPSELEVAAYANVALLQRAMMRAQSVALTVWGDDAGRIVRAAAERGLLVTATIANARDASIDLAAPHFAAADDAPGTTPGAAPAGRLGGADNDDDLAPRTLVEIAGPLALMRRTSIYGRALADIVPLLAELRSWSLDIHVELPLASYTLHAASPALLPTPPPRLVAPPYAVARLSRALNRSRPRLGIDSSPPMLRADDLLLWPDLVIDAGGALTYVELVGFWTREYLERKLAGYRCALAHDRGERVVLCVDVERGGRAETLPDEVLAYTKQVSVHDVLARIEPT